MCTHNSWSLNKCYLKLNHTHTEKNTCIYGHTCTEMHTKYSGNVDNYVVVKSYSDIIMKYLWVGKFYCHRMLQRLMDISVTKWPLLNADFLSLPQL